VQGTWQRERIADFWQNHLQDVLSGENCFLSGEQCMDHNLVTTSNELFGYEIQRQLGVVRGIIVRSRSVVGNIGAAFQQLVGGNITLYTKLCEQARNDAYELMIQHAQELGANGIIAVRYDATEIAPGVTEVLCYGTAVHAVAR
jgi:uncharacterized protein YbjQ (UPF0145 family)